MQTKLHFDTGCGCVRESIGSCTSNSAPIGDLVRLRNSCEMLTVYLSKATCWLTRCDFRRYRLLGYRCKHWGIQRRIRWCLESAHRIRIHQNLPKVRDNALGHNSFMGNLGVLPRSPWVNSLMRHRKSRCNRTLLFTYTLRELQLSAKNLLLEKFNKSRESRWALW